jgi:transposase-like protein
MFRRGREHWVATVAEFERSELTQESFARRRGVDVGTLRSWIYKLRRERKASVSLVPVRVIASTAPQAREAYSADVEVELKSGVRLRFSSGVALDYIAALVQRLG